MNLITKAEKSGNNRFLQRKKNIEMYFFVLFIVLLCMLLYQNFIFGDKLYIYNDANDDTFQSYLPAYQMVVNWLKAGNQSLMDLRIGFGSNLLSYQAVILDPFSIIVYVVGLVGGIEKVAYALVYVQIFRIVVAAVVCKLFLKKFQLSEYAQYMGATVFGFSGYMLGDIGQHYFLASAMVFCIIMYALIEHTRSNKKHLFLVSLVVMIICCWSVYIAFMILIASGVYAIIRWLYVEKYTWRSALRYFLPLSFAVICGIFLAGMLFIPSVALMMGTSGRLDSQISWIERIGNMFHGLELEQYVSMILRFFSNQLQGTVSSWSGAETSFNTPHLFASILVPIALVQYIYEWVTKKNSKEKKVVIISGLLVIAVCITQIAGTVMNALVAYQARYVFVLFPFFAYLLAWLLDRILIGKIHWGILGVSTTLFTFFIMSQTAWQSKTAKLSAINAVVCILIVVVLIWGGERNVWRENVKKIFTLGFAITLIFNVLFDGKLAIESERTILSKEWYKNNVIDSVMNDIMQAENISDKDFVRLERNYLGWGTQQAYTYSQVANYRGVSFYNSVINKNVFDYRKEYLREKKAYSNIAGAYAFNASGLAMNGILADLQGIKYVISDYQTFNPDWKLVRKIENKYLYENLSLDSAGLLFDKYCTQDEFEKMTELQKIEISSQALVLDELENLEGMSIEKYDTNDSKATIKEMPYKYNLEQSSGIQTLEKGNLQISKENQEKVLVIDMDMTRQLVRNMQAVLKLGVSSKINTNINVMCDTGFGFSEVYWAQENVEIQAGNGIYYIDIPVETQKIKICIKNEDYFDINSLELINISGMNYINEGVKLENPSFGGVIHGEVITNQDRLLLIPIFKENGWKAYIDGKETPIFSGNYAFITLKIPQGRHQIELVYSTPGLEQGKLMSIVGAIMLIALMWRTRKAMKV